MKILITIALLSAVSLCLDPPMWPVRFQQDFVESYPSIKPVSAGKIWFDSERAMERVDRTDGKFDPICGPLSKNATTPCSQLVREGKRWIIFHLLRQCCYCCDAAHGFGVMRRDWLKTAKFMGTDSLRGQDFYHWRVEEGDTDWWETIDGKHTPRRSEEDHYLFKDYIMNTYSEEYISSSIFDLPSYCADAKKCAKGTKCDMCDS